MVPPARTSRVARTPRAGWPSGYTRGRQNDRITGEVVFAACARRYDEWEPLQGDGASYRLRVQAEGVSSGEDTPGFSLLENADEFKTKRRRLEARPLDEPARSLLLAELYVGYGLRSEAVAVLNGAQGAEEKWQAAQKLYVQRGRSKDAETPAQLLAGVSDNCR